jgi:glycine/D-amino acid oxidase-like deaminating enzyme
MHQNKKFDFIIVGQGLAGTLLAHDLIELEKSVIIIDTHLKASASRVAAGLINPISMKRCIPAMPSNYLTTAFNRYSDLEDKLNSRFIFKKPLLRLFDALETKDLWIDKYENKQMDLYIDEFCAVNTFSFLKDEFSSAIVKPAGYLDLKEFLAVSREYFKDNNILLEEKFNFSEFNDRNVSYRNLKADKIIFCDGFRIKENPFFDYLPIAPTKGELMHIKIPSVEDFGKIISKGIYIIPNGNYEYTVGATYDRVDLTENLTKDGQNFLKEKLDEVLNVEYEIISSVAGVRPTVKDREPLIGMHKEFNNIGVFNGLGARGVLNAPHFSKEFSKALISDSIRKFDFKTIDRFH